MTNSAFPSIFRVRQQFDTNCLQDIPAEVNRQLAGLKLGEKVRPGQSVAITAGSRGIANIALITRSIVEYFKQLGAKPFIVPAMGSHGGGTADGQRKVLESYGITESSMGCPIPSGMETVVVCQAADGFPVHFDRLAYEADHVVICNRIKPHSGFQGDIESGLMKMLLIGLGNCEGARIYHRAILDYSFDRIVRGVAENVINSCPILAGVAIVENGYDQTAVIEAIRPEDFVTREKGLLARARKLMPRLPFDHVDVLLIDRMGKDISGVGFDPNVVGRKFNDHKALDDEYPKVRRICLRALTPASHGNATGMGMAEFCKTQFLRDTDLEATRLNCLVSGHVSAAMIPLDFETDREMLAAALGTIGLVEPPNAKLIWISDTLHLDEVECSAAYLNEAKCRDDLEILTQPRELPFNVDGNMPDFTQ
ncbi:MAG TPA: lactate racemase domain-containing protein [Thermoguttaceae bacterium]